MSEIAQTFSIPKTTGTHSDVFAAVGLADLLASIPDLGPVTLVEQGAEIEVRLTRPLLEEEISSVPQDPGYKYLRPNDKSSVPAGVSDYVDYPHELDRVDRYYKQRQLLRKQGKPDPEIEQLLQQDRPLPDWELWRALNSLQGDDTSNRVYVDIVNMGRDQFRRAVTQGLVSLKQNAPSGLKWDITQSMIFNPASAKGYRNPKPIGTKRKNFKIDEWGDPFLEWLKYRGYFVVACPRLVGGDVRVLAAVPRDISVRALERVAAELRKGGVYGGPVKLDTLAVLRLAELLVRHSEEYHADETEPFPGLALSGKTPAQVISGVTVTHYQSMGSAKAVSAMATLGLPDWFPIHSKDDALAWLAILDEHQRVVRGLRDDRSDEVGLLVAYRRFLEKRGEGAIWALVEFMERYGAFVMGANGRKEDGRTRWTPRFTDQHFRSLIETAVRQERATLDTEVHRPAFQEDSHGY